MLERLLVALLAGGHVLLEGVPGLAKTLTVSTLAARARRLFRRVQFTPDLVPADLVGTRIYRPDTGSSTPSWARCSATCCSPTRSTARPRRCSPRCWRSCRSSQVTIGGKTYPVPRPFLVLATQNPIESEGTYPLPEAQVDRFLMKLLVDYPTPGEEAAVVGPLARRRAPRCASACR